MEQKRIPYVWIALIVMLFSVACLISCSKSGDETGPEPEEGYPDHVVTTITCGSGTADVVVTPSGQYVYASNQMDGTVSVIQTSDHSVVETISTGGRPGALAILPNGNYLYVNDNSTGNSLFVIRTSDNTVTDTLTGSTNISGMDVTPNGEYLYVPVSGMDQVRVYRTSDHFMTTVDVGNAPYDVTVTPNNEFVYVCNALDHTVSIIQVSDNTVSETIPVGNYPISVTVNPDGGYVYCANYTDGDVSVIRVSDNAILASLDVSMPHDIAVTHDGEYIYVSGGSQTVEVFDASNNEFLTTVAVGLGPNGISAAPNGDYVYVANYTDGTVSVIGK